MIQFHLKAAAKMPPTQVHIEIPQDIADQLRLHGPDLAKAAKEALAIEAYRTEQLSIGQVAELLGISVFEAEGLMKSRGVPSSYSIDDFERDRETLKRVLGS
jgi:predicted HTH domain antitoxin